MRRPVRAALALLLVATVAAACSPVSTDSDEALEVYGPYVGPEADLFAESLATFESKTGIETDYVGSSSFQSDFESRINASDLPDVTVLPQLALLGSLLDTDHVTPIPTEASERITEEIGEFWAQIVAPEGQALAIPYRFVVKSIVWYRTDVFENQGYELPETMAELKALARRMIADGHTPWCGGMDSAGSTGWWATDWVEDLVVRNAGRSAYWSWAAMQIPFTDGRIVGSMLEFQEMVDREGAVNGGRRGILNVSVQDAILPMFDDPPGCLMHKQASFQPLWLPPDVEFGDGRLDIFPLPGVEPGAPPMLISGEFAAATSDDPRALDLIEYLFTKEAFEPWLDAGGSLIARAQPNEGDVHSELDRRLAEMVAATDTVVLDASDLMPQPLGTDAFFSGMVDLVAGRSASEVAANLQDVADSLNDG